MKQTPVTITAVVLMDRCGRRPLLLVSGLVIIHKLGDREQLENLRNKLRNYFLDIQISLVGACLGTFLIGVAFCLKVTNLISMLPKS